MTNATSMKCQLARGSVNGGASIRLVARLSTGKLRQLAAESGTTGARRKSEDLPHFCSALDALRKSLRKNKR